MRRVVRLGLLIAAVAVVHRALGTAVSVRGVSPELLLLVPVVAGFVAGEETGARVGFAAGFVADLWLLSPMGLSALTYALVGFAAGSLGVPVLDQPRWLVALGAGAASAVGVVVFAFVGATVGLAHLVSGHLLVVAVVVAVLNGILAPVVLPAVWWAIRPRPGTRAEVG